LSKLLSLGKFSDDVLKPNGEIVQVGDCDNGRFFKIQPLFYENTIDENHLTHKCLSDALSALGGSLTHGRFVEGDWIKRLNNIQKTKKYVISGQQLKQNKPNSNLPDKVKALYEDDSPIADSLLKELDIQFNRTSFSHNFNTYDAIAYPEFGLFIWKSESSLFTFKCGLVGQKQRGGHDHNDQLSIEYFNNGHLEAYDPGTAIYTPLPEIRNKYRSIKAHNGPIVTDPSGRVIEPGPLDQGLFSMNGNQACEILCFTPRTIAGYSLKLNALRIVKLGKNEIDVIDICMDRKFSLLPQNFAPIALSKGYGFF
jgi:hypothetical protein